MSDTIKSQTDVFPKPANAIDNMTRQYVYNCLYCDIKTL